MNYVAFDLEIAEELPEGCEDWKAHRPLGISCAVTLAVSPGGREEQRWHGAEQADGRLAGRMTPSECRGLALYLLDMASKGYQIVTWNGLGFDFDVLAEEVADPVMWLALRNLALVHVDPAFQMLCEKGFMCGLEAAGKGLGVGKKFEDVHGADAPILWMQERDDQDRVLDYCAQDVALTAAVHDEIVKRRYLTWIKKDGRVSSPWRPTFYTQGELTADRLLTVTEALALPIPDTSWMDKPWPRPKFLGWTEHVPGQATSASPLADLVVALADARAKEEVARHQTEAIGDQIEQTELGQALATARRVWEEARQAATAADGALRSAALAAWDGNKHPHQAVEIAEWTGVEYDSDVALRLAVARGWFNCLLLVQKTFQKRAIRAAEALTNLPRSLDDIPDLRAKIVDLLTLDGVKIVKAPMVKVNRDLSEWATPADQLSLPIEEEVSNG